MNGTFLLAAPLLSPCDNLKALLSLEILPVHLGRIVTLGYFHDNFVENGTWGVVIF